MEEISLIIQAILASGGLVVIGGLIWRTITQDVAIRTGNEKLDAIIEASQKTAIATDDYIRSMADGTLTIEEGEEFKNKAAEAIISQLTMVEVITGKQVYNRTEVPLPLPVGGKRSGDPALVTLPEQPIPVTPIAIPEPVPPQPEPPIEQPAQPVSPPGA